MSNKQSYLVAVVVPMYNEEVEAQRCIKTIQQYISKISSLTLVVVNDGSSDGTKDILAAAKKIYGKSIHIVTHSQNLGYGAAIRSGIEKGKRLNAAYLLFMDADLTNHPRYIIDFIRHIPLGFDCVKASRYIAGGKVIGVPFYRQVFSITGNSILKNICRLPLADNTNGFRLVRTELLSKIPYTKNDFSLLVEEMFFLKKIQAKCAELPYTLTTRKNSSSHFVYSLSQFKNYVSVCYKAFFV